MTFDSSVLQLPAPWSRRSGVAGALMALACLPLSGCIIIKRGGMTHESRGTFLLAEAADARVLVIRNHVGEIEVIADPAAGPFTGSYPICTVNRSVGTMLSHEISKAHGATGLPSKNDRSARAGHGLDLPLPPRNPALPSCRLQAVPTRWRGRPVLLVTVQPICLDATGCDPSALMQDLGLTRREAELAASLAAGRSRLESSSDPASASGTPIRSSAAAEIALMTTSSSS